MASYRVRRVFRVLAGVLAILALAFGLVVLASSLTPLQWFAIRFAALFLVVGVLLASLAVTGRVPAALEECGLDEADEIETLRTKMARLGRFIP